MQPGESGADAPGKTDGSAPSTCPVCRGGPVLPFQTIGATVYWHCARCAARWIDPSQHPTPEAERAHYAHHENQPDDPRYRRFLSRLADPLLARLAPGSAVLDFGCGPGPALAAMLREAGHRVALYDPVFAPDDSPLHATYDAVTCTEVAEHFHRPAAEFDRLRTLVRPGGWLAVMTCFQTDDTRFAGWRYRQDPTHVVFYRAETFHVLAALWGWTCVVPEKDVVLLRRPAS
jgi:SAM-dependent methyltransferase